MSPVPPSRRFGLTRRATVGLLVLLVLLGLGLVRVGPASGVSGAPFGLRPGESGSVPLPGGHFHYALPAGSTVSDSIVIENLTSSPETLQVFGADLIPLRGGGFGVAQLGQKMLGVGAWLSVQPTARLSAFQQLSVPFTLSVPPDTPGGDYAGAIVAQNQPGTTPGVAIQTRVALQIQVQVPGTTVLAARVGVLQAKSVTSGIRFDAVLTNTGTETFRFTGYVDLRRGGSALVVKLALRPGDDLLLPGQHLDLSGMWKNPPRWGSVTASAHVVANPSQGAARTFRDGVLSLSFFPWFLVLLAILALLLLLLVLREAWRRREQWAERIRAERSRRRAIRQFKAGLGGAPPASGPPA